MTLLTRLHRWFGLAAAAFLFQAGLTGAVIAFDHELDAALNPSFYAAPTAGPADPLAAADALEAARGVDVTWLPLALEPGESLRVFVAAKPGGPMLSADNLALDPATGAVLGARAWGRELTRLDLIPWLYRLHYSLHAPVVAGVEPGVVGLGLLAIGWSIDAVVALWISFPSWKTWRRSLAFSWRGKRALFDLHRSGGVWTWLLVLPIAVTAVAMNLGDAVVRPAVGLVSTLAPDPFDDRAPRDRGPHVARRVAVDAAIAVAGARGWTDPPGALFYAPDRALYGVGFFAPGQEHGDGGLGNPWVYVDAATGAVVDARSPGEGSWGDGYLQAQFPVHSGRLLGLPGRALVAALGLVVATLSATGVALWARRTLRRAS